MRLVPSALLVACALLTAGCGGRRTPVVVATPASAATLALQSANQEFAMAEYESAARDYERYLQLVPSGGSRDEALFQLGLIYALPEGGLQNWPRAIGFLNSLLTEFPQSSLKPTAQLILSMRDQAAQLSAEIAKLTNESSQFRNDIAQLQNEAAQLRNDSAQLRSDATQLRTTSTQLTEQVMQLTQEVEKRDQRIKQLNTELERLIRIDSERRPRP